MTKLDRLARSVPDARNIVDELTASGVRLSIGGSVHDPADPIGRLLFNVLSMVAEFEADLIRARTREGMAIAKAKAGSGGARQSSPPSRRRTWWSCTGPARTPAVSWPSCSGWPGPPCTGQSAVARVGEQLLPAIPGVQLAAP